jgi:AcrR family transcriptional regulator
MATEPIIETTQRTEADLTNAEPTEVEAAAIAATYITPGRPRDDSREQAILDAALALVAEVGFERMTMESIAARAKASKATIYRRWASKLELVVDAMSCYAGDTGEDLEDTGTVEGDLLALVRLVTDKISGFDGHLILGLSQAALSSPGLCAALEEQMGPSKLRMPSIVVKRAVARGELPPGADPMLFNEITPAVVIMRLINGMTLDEPFLGHLVEDILLPALRHQPSLYPTLKPQAVPAGTAENGPAGQSNLQNPPNPARSNQP